LKRNFSINLTNLPRDYESYLGSLDLKKDVISDENGEDYMLEGYRSLACILAKKGWIISFMEEQDFVDNVDKGNSDIFMGSNIIIGGNWPFQCKNLSNTFQKIEDLCTVGIKRIFPNPSDVLFAAHKHR